MKTKLLITTIILLLTVAISSFGQQKTDYTIEDVAGHYLEQGEFKSISSTYWYGNTWFFQWNYSTETYHEGYWLEYSQLEIDSDGHIEDSYTLPFHAEPYQNLNFESHVSSCVFNKSLFVFYYNKDSDENNNISFYVKSMQSDFKFNSISISEETTKQMATVAANDTLYIFFVDEGDRKIKYYRGLYKANQYNVPDIEWISSTPAVLSHSLLPIGNVSACNYTDDDNNEKIMVAFAGDVTKGTNEINIFTGIQDNFEIYKQIQTPTDHHAEDVAIEQGSVKGGGKQGYFFQLGYSKPNIGAEKGPIRCEINMQNNEYSDWEITELDFGDEIDSQFTGFMTYYNKGAFKREKHLYQMFTMDSKPEMYAVHWESDQLIYHNSVEKVPPINYASKFYDLVVVVEGAPPYALNGHKLGDQKVIHPPSTFDFQKTTEITVATTTTYKQSVDAKMGYGPVTVGFKASFMESSGSSTTKSLSIDEIIRPPLANNDSAGVMFYYYVTPTVVRSQWNLCDYDGDTLLEARSLFFFTFESAQLITLPISLNNFVDSPQAYNLTSYGRKVQDLTGMQTLTSNQVYIDIAAGGTAKLDLTFSETNKNEYSESFTVSLGVAGEYELFSASVGAKAKFEYTRERETKCENSFHIEWDNPAPTNQHDTNNIQDYVVTSYVMETTDSTAFYLLEGFKNYQPIFITYEVDNVHHGAFGYESIGENSIDVEKYSFTNYPNPCTNKSKFAYQLPGKSHVSLTVYNAYGQTVNMPLNEAQSPGQHQYELSTSNLPSGIYYYRMLIDEDLIMGKIIKN